MEKGACALGALATLHVPFLAMEVVGRPAVCGDSLGLPYCVSGFAHFTVSVIGLGNKIKT